MKKILLIGYRGVGKTTIGSALAKRMSVPFIEMDQIINAITSKTIEEIISETGGWNTFREIEYQLLLALLHPEKGLGELRAIDTILIRVSPEIESLIISAENSVISCGGGVGVNDIEKVHGVPYGKLETDAINTADVCFPIWFHADWQTIEDRLVQDAVSGSIAGKNRPSLNNSTHEHNNQTAEEHRRIIRESQKPIYERRIPLYTAIAGDHMVDTSKLSIDEAVKRIITFLA